MSGDFAQGDVDRAVAALAAGQAVVIPTDTVYGLAADPRSSAAMERLFTLKERPNGVPVAVLVADVADARGLIEWSPEIEELAHAHWPGALTIVGKALDAEMLAGTGETLGVRLADHAFVHACAKRFGPIAATSANRHGKPTITDPDELQDAFGSEVEVIVDGGVLDGIASTVVDVTTVRPTILRQGVVLIKSAD